MAANVPDFLEVLQEECCFRLASDPVFATVKVFLQRKGDIANDVLNALSVLNEGDTGKIGACAIILMPDLGEVQVAALSPSGTVFITTRVLEAPLFNQAEGGTGLSAEKLCLRALRVLCFRCEITGTLLAGKGDAIRPYTKDQDAGIIGYDVIVQGRAGIATGDKAFPCILSGDASAVTITADADGASIYYTTDTSYPGSGNPTAILYTVPFAVEEGALVRACAEHPDLVSSEPVSKRFLNP